MAGKVFRDCYGKPVAKMGSAYDGRPKLSFSKDAPDLVEPVHLSDDDSFEITDLLRWLADHLGYEVRKKGADPTPNKPVGDGVQWEDGSVSRDDRDYSRLDALEQSLKSLADGTVLRSHRMEIQEQIKNLNNAIARLESRNREDDKRFERFDCWQRNIYRRVGQAETEISKHERRLDGICDRIGGVGKRLNRITDDISAHNLRLNSDAAKVAELGDRVSALLEGVADATQTSEYARMYSLKALDGVTSIKNAMSRAAKA